MASVAPHTPFTSYNTPQKASVYQQQQASGGDSSSFGGTLKPIKLPLLPLHQSGETTQRRQQQSVVRTPIVPNVGHRSRPMLGPTVDGNTGGSYSTSAFNSQPNLHNQRGQQGIANTNNNNHLQPARYPSYIRPKSSRNHHGGSRIVDPIPIYTNGSSSRSNNHNNKKHNNNRSGLPVNVDTGGHIITPHHGRHHLIYGGGSGGGGGGSVSGGSGSNRWRGTAAAGNPPRHHISRVAAQDTGNSSVSCYF